jgi:hypothetical protein
MNTHSSLILARDHAADLIDEARRERLARERFAREAVATHRELRMPTRLSIWRLPALLRRAGPVLSR